MALDGENEAGKGDVAAALIYESSDSGDEATEETKKDGCDTQK